MLKNIRNSSQMDVLTVLFFVVIFLLCSFAFFCFFRCWKFHPSGDRDKLIAGELSYISAISNRINKDFYFYFHFRPDRSTTQPVPSRPRKFAESQWAPNAFQSNGWAISVVLCFIALRQFMKPRISWNPQPTGNKKTVSIDSEEKRIQSHVGKKLQNIPVDSFNLWLFFPNNDSLKLV